MKKFFAALAIATAAVVAFATPSQAGLLSIFQPKPKIVATISLSEQKMFVAVTDTRGKTQKFVWDVSTGREGFATVGTDQNNGLVGQIACQVMQELQRHRVRPVNVVQAHEHRVGAFGQRQRELAQGFEQPRTGMFWPDIDRRRKIRPGDCARVSVSPKGRATCRSSRRLLSSPFYG